MNSPRPTRADELAGFADGLAGFDDEVARLVNGRRVDWCVCVECVRVCMCSHVPKIVSGFVQKLHAHFRIPNIKLSRI